VKATLHLNLLFSDLSKSKKNIGKASGVAEVSLLILNMREYWDKSVKDGDKVTIEIKKSESSRIEITTF
jgi:hypothetical protein